MLMVALVHEVMLHTPHLLLHRSYAHRMILAAFVVAAKFHEYCSVRNTEFAYDGSVSVDELNSLEEKFLKALD